MKTRKSNFELSSTDCLHLSMARPLLCSALLWAATAGVVSNHPVPSPPLPSFPFLSSSFSSSSSSPFRTATGVSHAELIDRLLTLPLHHLAQMSRMIDLARNSEAAGGAGGAGALAYAAGQGGKGIMYYSDSRTRDPLVEVATTRGPPPTSTAAAAVAAAAVHVSTAASNAVYYSHVTRVNRPQHATSFVDLGDREYNRIRGGVRVSASARASSRAFARNFAHTSDGAGSGAHGAPGGSTQENPPEFEQVW